MFWKSLYLAAAFAVFPLLAEDYKIDSAHSSAQFTVKHMMVTNVRGAFSKLTGTISYDEKNPTAIAIDATIDASAIDTREPKRDDHLRSADFFDVAKFPTITFKSKSAKKTPGGLAVTGDLTLRGTTREIVLDVEGPTPEIRDARGGARRGAAATTKISRKDFGLTWNRAIEAGGVAVSDEVQITIDIAATRPPA